MAHDFSMPVGRKLTLSVEVVDPDVLQYLMCWMHSEKEKERLTDDGKRLLDNSLLKGLTLTKISFGDIVLSSEQVEGLRKTYESLKQIMEGIDGN